MGMKDELNEEQIKNIQILTCIDKIHEVFISGLNDALLRIEHDSMHRLAFFEAFKYSIKTKVINEITVEPELKTTLTKYFDEYYGVISKYIPKGGNPQDMVNEASEWLRQFKMKITGYDSIGSMLGSRAFTTLMHNELKLTFISFIRQYIQDEDFMAADDPKGALINAMTELNNMIGNKAIDIEWLKDLSTKLFGIDDAEKRLQFLRSQEILLTQKQEIRTVEDVTMMGLAVERTKKILLDESLDEESREAFVKFSVREIIEGDFPRTLVIDIIDVMKEYRENPLTCDKNLICDKLDELVEKYTPTKEDLRKNTLLNNLAKGTSKIVVTDEKADDELNWENIGL